MKKLLSLILAAMLMLSLAVPASAAESTPKTYAAFSIPVPETFDGCELCYDKTEDSRRTVAYQNASEDTQELYLQVCASMGLYPLQQKTKDGTVFFYLCSPGTDIIGKVLLDESQHFLFVQHKEGTPVVTDKDLEQHLEYYNQTLKFPASMGKLVFPQFYASAGLNVSSVPGQVVKNTFGDKSAWVETYKMISYEQFRKYIDEMILCGFRVTCANADQNDDGVITQIKLLLSQDDCELYAFFNVISDDVNVVFIAYKSGVTYQLLSGSDYAKYIPQRQD